MAGWDALLGVFDLETTGVDPAEARIVSATIGLLDADGRLIRQRSWLADPGVEIPDGAAAVHGITTERARAEGRPAAQVVAELLTTLRGLLDHGVPVVVYNAPYDLTLLAAEAVRHGLPPIERPAPIVDPLVIDRAVDRFRRGKRTLTLTAAHYGVPLLDAHDAAADAIAAGRVAQALARAFPDELGMPAMQLHEAQLGWFRDQAESFQEFIRERRDPDYLAPTEWPVGRGTPPVIRIAAAIIESGDGRLLFVRKRGTTAFMQPGGKLEAGETPDATLVRELREELAIDVPIVRLRHVGRFSAAAANEAGHLLDAHVFDVPLDAVPVVSAELEELAWVDPLRLGDRHIAPLSRDILVPLVLERRDAERRAMLRRPA